ncbi:MAG: hypothetical protein ACLGHY_13820, partial [Gammaproteobacteria bacterium]
ESTSALTPGTTRSAARAHSQACPAMFAGPMASTDGRAAVGAGTSITWVDPERRLVAVVRWIDGTTADTFLGRVAHAAFGMPA